jgi:tetratricopeptide (TPR) repeat protein
LLPQGLKPLSLLALCGTAEAVPCPTQNRFMGWLRASNRSAALGHVLKNYFRDLSKVSPADYFCHRAILASQNHLEDFVRRCVQYSVRGWVVLLLAASSLWAEHTPAATSSDAIFLWLASGISSARIERLAQMQHGTLSCASVSGSTSNAQCARQCLRALQAAGADSELIQELLPSSSGRAAKENPNPNGGANIACAWSSPAAQVAALVHEKKLNAAEDKLRAMLRNASDDGSGCASGDGENELLHFALGIVLRREERFDEALDEFTESSRLMPGFPETHSQLSYLFYRTEDADDALAEARTALSIDPANAEAYRYLGLALYADGHYDAALHAFDESLAREPEESPADADVYFDMGITLRDRGDLRSAAVAYRHALSLRADFWEAHSNLGVVLHDQGKLEEAVTEYRAAKRLKPDEASVRNNLGNTLCDKQDFDGAIKEFTELYRQSPEWEGGHNCLARAYMSKRDYPSAIRELHLAIAANPAGAAEHRVLGQALLLSGKDQEAVDVLREAVTLNPESALGHHYLGTALVDTQQLLEAEKEFREALRLEPSAENHFSLAACLMALNQYDEALGELEIASRMDPSQNLYRARMQEVVKLITSTK